MINWEKLGISTCIGIISTGVYYIYQISEETQHLRDLIEYHQILRSTI